MQRTTLRSIAALARVNTPRTRKRYPISDAVVDAPEPIASGPPPPGDLVSK
jgi:hypothetical protein